MAHNEGEGRQLLTSITKLQIELENLKDRVKEDREKGDHLMESLAKEIKGLESCVKDFKSLYKQDKARVEGAMWTSGKFWAFIIGAVGLGFTISKLVAL